MKKRKVYEISVIDKTYSKTISDETKFYTSDTALELTFELKETEYTFESAEIVLLNIDDRSLVTRPVSKVNNDFVYELDDDITAHYGEWRGQVRFEQEGETYVSSPVKFRIENDLSNERPPQLSDVQSWVSLKRYADELTEELKQAVLSIEGVEDAFNANELERQNQFDSAEQSRQDTFEANESERDRTFNTNEATRQENENARIEAEKQREGTVTKIENRQTFVENQFSIINQELTDKNVISAPEIIAARGDEPTLNARLDKDQQEVTEQLAQKVSKGNVNINDFDESTRQTFLEAQGIDVNYVLGDGNVKIENIAFTKKSTNLFNSAEQKENFYVDLYSGKEVASNSFIASGFIPVEPATEYYIRMVSHVVFYDDKKGYLGSDGSGARLHHVTTAHPNAKFMRISWLKTADPGAIQQVNKGNEQLPFQDYFIKIDKDYVELGDINESDLPDIPINKLSFVTQKNNLFNKDTVAYDHYVSTESGNLTSAPSFVASDYIPIKPSHLYTIRLARRYAFYDKDKMFISGKSDTILTHNLVVDAPENAHFIRFSWYPPSDGDSPDTQQINEGSELLPYESFGYIIKNDFLPNSMDTEELIVTLPPKIYALVGQELNIYFDNIIDAKDKDYDFDVECLIGANFNNYYRVIPSVAGAFDITIKVLKNTVELAVATSKIIVADSGVGNGVNKNVLVIGDSTTAQNGGQVVQKLTDNFSSDVMNISMVGTKGTSPNFHEGKSGWTTKQHYSSEDSSFVYNGSFNFSEFITSNSLTTPDYVILNLGINDMFSFRSDESVLDKATEMVSQYENMITSIKTHNTNVIIGIGLTIPPNYSQDAFGFAYKNGQTRTRYKRNNILLVNELIKEFKGRESENIHLVPINTNLDTRYNMGSQEVQVNARNETVITTQVANGGVHPWEGGYHQIADVYWYWLKSFEI